MTARLVSTAYGAAALATLRTVVGELKSADPMAPVTILAPNNIAGIVARRHLAAGTGAHPGIAGIAGIDVTTIARLAERLAAASLAPRRPTVRPVLAAAWRRALAEAPGRFADIAEHPATVRALADAHRQLRDLTPAARAAVAAATPVSADLVRLHDSVTGRLEDGWYDATDLLAAAADRVDTADLGQIVLYLPQLLTRAETALVEALAATTDLTVVAGFTDTTRADAAIFGVLDRLGLRAPTADRTTIPTAGHVINASDSDDEVRCVVRDLVAALETTPAHRIAVLYSAASPYARLLHEQLAAAGITVNGAGTRSADERAVARALLEILALADHDLPRGDLFRALANAPVRDFTGERIPVAPWERLSRAAGVVAGEDWQTRLDGYIDDQRARAAGELASAEPRPDRLERQATAAARLRDFATELRAQLQRAAGLTNWHDLATWCLDLFTTLVCDTDALTRLPVEEQYAASTVISVLGSLDGLDAVDAAPSYAALLDVLDLELAGSLPRVGRFGEGVLIAPMSAAVGLDLDVVYVVGLAEDLYPGRLRPDALLPERARDATDGELPSARERLHTKLRQLLAAVAAAPRSVATFPRGDLRRSTHRLPSRWLLPSLRELADDHQLPATEWDRPAYAGTVSTAASYAGELARTDRLASEQEWRTREAFATGRLDDGVLIAAVEMIRARAGDHFTRYDGNLAGLPGLPDYATDERPVAPTTLESYAGCPHSFFVERMLGVRPIEQPEDIVETTPLTIGNLMHESIDEFVHEYADQLPGYGEPWTEHQRGRLAHIVSAKAADYEQRGLTGHPRLWEGERLRILSDIGWMIDDDNRWRSEQMAAVLGSEMAFGIGTAPAVEIPVPGGRVRMRGSADLVAIGADGTIFVTDIKTGSRRTFKNISQAEPLVGGTKLQLPVYAYAARAQYGDGSTPVQANYWFVRRDPGRIAVNLTDTVEQQYADTVATLVQSIAAGFFPPRAPEVPDFSWVQCGYCNPDGIGHAENRERWERKRRDPALRDYLALVEPAVLAEAAP